MSAIPKLLSSHKRMKRIVACFSIFSLLIQITSGLVFSHPVYSEEITPPVPTVTAVITPTQPTPEEFSITPTPEIQPTLAQPTTTPTVLTIQETTVTPTPTTEVVSQTTPTPVLESQVIGNINENGPPTITPTPSPELSLEAPISQESAQLNYSVGTDMADYAPESTVKITGNGYGANQKLTIRVTWPDGTVRASGNKIGETDSSVANGKGELSFDYLLTGGQLGTYKVEVLDINGTVLATTTFTDGPVSGCTTDSAGANDEPGQKDLSKMCVNYSGLPSNINVSWNWDDTSFSGNNTGDACSLYDTDGDGLANYSLCVGVSGTSAAWTYTRLYSCGDGRSDRCDQPTVLINSPTSTCAASVQGTDPFTAGSSYPNDTEANCNVNMSDVGGNTATLIDVCSYPSGEPNSDPSDCILLRDRTGKLEVIKDLIPSTDNGLFNLQVDGQTEAASVGDEGTTGEKIVSAGSNNPVNHTVGETAGTGTSLSSYTTSIVCKDLNGTGSIVAQSANAGPLDVPVLDEQDIVCTITNSLQNGSIVVHKDVSGPNGEDIVDASQNFTVKLDGANSQSITDGGTVTYSDVATGTHTITEDAPPAGYTLYSITPDSDGGLDGAQVTVAAGQTTDVYVTNRQQNTTLTLTKSVNNDNGGTKLVSDFVLKIDGSSVTSGVANNVTPGSHTASEVNLAGYSASSWGGDCNTDGTITLALGANKTCTIINDDIQPKLTVTKIVESGTASVGDFPLFVGGTQVTSGVQNGFNAGSYIVSETSQGGYTGVVGGDCNESGNITLRVGDVKSCTITNSRDTGDLKVLKIVDYGSVTDWYFSLDGGIAVQADTNGYVDFGQVTTLDEHTIIESGSLGTYFLDSVTGANCTPNLVNNSATATVDKDGTTICTFSNAVNKASLTIIKNAVPDDPQDFTFTTSDNLTGFNLDDDSDTTLSNTQIFNGLFPGSYTVSESSLEGWTTNVECSRTPDFQDGNTVSFNLTAGENVSCTFANTKQPKLTVVKEVINNNGGSLGVSDFPLFVDSNTVTSGESNIYTIGSHTVSETQKEGYVGVIGGDCASDGSIILAAGDEKTCTITNDDQAGTLIVKKVVINDNGGTLRENNFSFSVNSASAVAFEADGQNNLAVDAGTFTITEPAVTGYETTSDNCTDLLIGNGETATCTITNDDIAPRLTLTKTVVNNNGGLLTQDDFEVYLNDEISSWGTQTVTAGSYTVREVSVPGYVPSSWGGDCASDGTVNLEVGDDKNCTITNTDQPGSISGQKFEDEDGDGVKDEGENGLANWTINLSGTVNTSVSTDPDGSYTFADLPAGIYNLTESQQDGWTQTTPNPGTINLANGQAVTGRNFGNFELVTISGKKFNDLNGDHLRTNTTTDPNLPNWIIRLDRENDSNPPVCGTGTLNGEFCEQTTNSFGNYSFADLPPGTYRVSEVLQNGWIQTRPDETYGGQGLQADGTYLLTASSGIDIDDRDFGNRGNLSITACKYEDSDGLQEGGDLTPVNGWDFTLGQTTQNTGESNCTTFSNLTPGEYEVSEGSLEGWFIADDSAGTRSVTLTDFDQTIDFANYRKGSIKGMKWDDEDASSALDCTYNEFEEEICETGLSGWTIFIDQGEQSTTTDELGNYAFENLEPGYYTICEDLKNGWQQTYPNSEGEDCHSGWISSGEDVEGIDFGNQQLGRIIINKVTDPGNSESTFEFTTNYNEGFFLGNGGSNDSGFITPGTYSVSENTPDGWDVVAACDDQSLSEEIDLQPGETVTCTFTNTQRGSIGDFIWEDSDGGADQDAGEPGISGVTVNLYQDDGDGIFEPGVDDLFLDSQITDGVGGGYLFNNLAPGDYWVDVDDSTIPEGFIITTGNDPLLVQLDPGAADAGADFGYRPQTASVSLAKTNNRTGGASAGDSVNYTLTLTNGPVALSNVTVMDALPSGFTYVAGSGQVGGVNNEPTISGGLLTWSSISLAVNQVLTITYQAKIDSGQSAGTYYNLATCHGTSRDKTINCEVVNSSVPVGQVFSSSWQIGGTVLGEATPQVLGAATGSPTYWLFIALLLIVSGFFLRSLDEKRVRKLKGFIKGFFIFILLTASLYFVKPVMASDLTVKMTKLPDYVNYTNIKLSYTALQVTNQPVQAQFSYREKDGTWRTVGSAINGSSGSVETDSSQINKETTYEFKVVTTSNGETSEDQATTIFDLTPPAPPSDYGKERINPTTYRLTWKNPDNDDFSAVYVYRSDTQNFTADKGTLVAQMAGAKDAKVVWENGSVESGKDYYYALRSVDKAGNFSNLIGDGGSITTIKTTPSPTVRQVGEVKLLPKEDNSSGGQILGGSSDVSPAPEQKVSSGRLDQAVAEIAKNAAKQPMYIVLGIVVLVLFGYLLYRRRSA